MTRITNLYIFWNYSKGRVKSWCALTGPWRVNNIWDTISISRKQKFEATDSFIQLLNSLNHKSVIFPLYLKGSSEFKMSEVENCKRLFFFIPVMPAPGAGRAGALLDCPIPQRLCPPSPPACWTIMFARVLDHRIHFKPLCLDRRHTCEKHKGLLYCPLFIYRGWWRKVV